MRNMIKILLHKKSFRQKKGGSIPHSFRNDHKIDVLLNDEYVKMILKPRQGIQRINILVQNWKTVRKNGGRQDDVYAEMEGSEVCI